MASKKYILITNPVVELDEQEWRDGNDKRSLIPIEQLGKNIHAFINDIGTILDKVDATLSKYEMEEIEISAAITTKGQLSLIGIGGEMGVEGGIKFIFKKKP